MKKWITGTILLTAVILSSCNDDGLDAITVVDSNFETGIENWKAEFAEYHANITDSTLSLVSAQTRLPKGLDTTQHALMIQGANRSDDMFMYLKKRVSGLVPNANYSVQIEVNFGTNYPANSIGIGGSPGSSVYLKAGVSAIEPARKLEDGFYHFNLDKGAQSQIGKDAVLLGDISNGKEDTSFVLVKKSTIPITVKASAEGEIWLFVGTDSGFEGTTRLYYDRIRASITAEQLN
jgi:hypothetical protein